MAECIVPEGHLFNKWAIEGGAVCSLCGTKLTLRETLTMLCEYPTLKRENKGLRELFWMTLYYWMGPEFGHVPTDKEMYNKIADVYTLLAEPEKQEDRIEMRCPECRYIYYAEVGEDLPQECPNDNQKLVRKKSDGIPPRANPPD